MAIKKYKYNDTTQLTEHFNVKEFKCKCGKNHDIYIDDNLPKLLEELRKELNASKINIASGYRCPEHNKAVGSSNATSGYSHSGYAGDIDCYDQNGKKITSKVVVLKLEDMGHKCGIGYRCGGANTRTHVDTKPRKWYGDEKYSNSASIGSSFYTYLKVPKPSKNTYQLLFDKWLRKQPKVATNTIQKIKKGVKIVSIDNKIYKDNKNNEWVYTNLNGKSGYICVKDKSGIQAKKI